MAVRAPLKLDSNNNFVEMSSTDIQAVINQAKYLYGTQPSVSIRRDTSDANLGAIYDTRLQAGASSTSVSSTPSQATTQDVSTKSTTHDSLARDDFAYQMAKAILSSIVNVAHPFRSWVEETVGGRHRGDINNDGSLNLSDVTMMLQYVVGTASSANIAYIDEYLLKFNVEDTNNRAYPVYYDSGNIKAMSLDDMHDTFIHPAITQLTDGTDQPGTFRIHTANTLTGHTLISSTPIFIDTRANLTLYTASGIGEDIDQPEDITNYYLFQTNSGSSYTYPTLLYARSDGHLQQYATSAFDTILKNLIVRGAGLNSGYTISYNINGTGNNRGSGMVDTVLNGTGNYQTLFVNTNDYRAQEFPNGTPVTANTYFLKITKV